MTVDEGDGDLIHYRTGPARAENGRRPAWAPRIVEAPQHRPARRAPQVPGTAGEARALVQQALRDSFGPDATGETGDGLGDTVVFADALLVTSELVTNAIRHGGGLTGFDVQLEDSHLTLHVSDASPEFPTATRPDGPFDLDRPLVGGYGWPLVRRLCREVSVRPLPDGGKCVTITLSLV
ncbi:MULTISPECIES: ATP-binding protein [Streptomyces]|uniref:ATP-binding protein n=1 Tax=Streptomyces odorifer TaxID=53450 RepID=A0A7Y6F2H2_9ACTN|nr:MULTISPECIES: ATP-binding protein [Streptomyces]NUV37818.1 ATP-binding protein [Streptomyces sp. KAI-27]NUV50304.1 ATP-binding protein [Streptomyces sp. CAI-78]MBL0803550.1 ATP-binding protein [Streptomyces albidoflavus]MCG5121954.1 ATP-binding protein [Streptomyces sp. T7(2022)]MCR0988557.1 ATP-binding protein [Streptomyces albidoflavus]